MVSEGARPRGRGRSEFADIRGKFTAKATETYENVVKTLKKSPTVPQGHMHRVTTLGKSRGPPQRPVEPAEPSKRTLPEASGNPCERQISSESLVEGCERRPSGTLKKGPERNLPGSGPEKTINKKTHKQILHGIVPGTSRDCPGILLRFLGNFVLGVSFFLQENVDNVNT